MSFEDSSGVYRDLSGNRLDARHSTSTSGRRDGAFGLAFDPSAFTVTVPFAPKLLPGPQGTTIEAWIGLENDTVAAAIFGDPEFGAAETPTRTQVAFYLVERAAVRDLAFSVMDGCAGPVVTATTPAVVGNSTHVAVAWDRTDVRFYVDGVLAATEPLVAEGCELGRSILVGRAVGGGRRLSGFIDELKVSDYAKSADEIVASMSFDSFAMAADCGNLVVTAGEQCDSDSMCCDRTTCQFVAQDTSCGSGICNGQGSCVVDGLRTTSDAIVLYDFDEPAPGLIPDISGVAPALDLSVGGGPGAATLDGDTLTVSGAAEISSAGDTARVASTIRESGAFTIETWVRPATDNQSGPARIVTLSNTTDLRNAMIGQLGGDYQTRIKSTGASNNGFPVIRSEGGRVTTDTPTHVVLTRGANGARRLWINGELVEQSQLAGTLNWDPSFAIRLANEGAAPGEIGDRPFFGTFHLVAIYAVAFDETRVSAHFYAGPQ